MMIKKFVCSAGCFGMLLGAATPAYAAEGPAGEGGIEMAPVADPAGAATEGGAEAGAAAPEAIKAIVRGFFIEGRVGGALGVVSAKLPDAARTGLDVAAGTREGLGSGGYIHMAVGYDLTNFVALEVVTGATLVSTNRHNAPIRDLSLVFGGPALRLSMGVGERFNLLVSAGVAYLSASNAVESSTSGVAVLGGLGLEYFVHVRHFSIGLDLSVLAPLNPMRVVVGLAPQVKYTF